jgi:hypothetical protein
MRKSDIQSWSIVAAVFKILLANLHI